MKVVIDIPNEEYERVIAGKWEGNPLADYIENAQTNEERPQGDLTPTVCGNNPKWCESCVSKDKCASTRPRE